MFGPTRTVYHFGVGMSGNLLSKPQNVSRFRVGLSENRGIWLMWVAPVLDKDTPTSIDLTLLEKQKQSISSDRFPNKPTEDLLIYKIALYFFQHLRCLSHGKERIGILFWKGLSLKEKPFPPKQKRQTRAGIHATGYWTQMAFTNMAMGQNPNRTPSSEHPNPH